MKPTTRFLILLPLLLGLLGCGTLQITVINPGQTPQNPQGWANAPTTPAPTATSVVAELATPTATPDLPEPTPQGGVYLPLRLNPGEHVTITRIWMLDEETGWGIGRGPASALEHVLVTSDGGRSWSDVTPAPVLAQNELILTRVEAHFSGRSSAWVIYHTQDPSAINQSSLVWITDDRGKNWWASQPLDYSGLNVDLLLPAQIGFSDANNGWLLVKMDAGVSPYYLSIFTTGDGGATWKRVVDPAANNLPMGCVINSAAFVGEKHGWVVGTCNGALPGVFFYATADAGATWQPVTLPDPPLSNNLFADPANVCDAESLTFSEAQTGRMVVRCTFFELGRYRAWIYLTRDGGNTWAPISVPTPYGFYDFFNPQLGYWFGSARPNDIENLTLFATLDGGENWHAIINPGWFGPIEFVNPDTGWIIAHSDGSTALVYTNNGGRRWERIDDVIGP